MLGEEKVSLRQSSWIDRITLSVHTQERGNEWTSGSTGSWERVEVQDRGNEWKCGSVGTSGSAGSWERVEVQDRGNEWKIAINSALRYFLNANKSLNDIADHLIGMIELARAQELIVDIGQDKAYRQVHPTVPIH